MNECARIKSNDGSATQRRRSHNPIVFAAARRGRTASRAARIVVPSGRYERDETLVRTYDIFSGLGGSSHGAAAAGATIVGGIDAWRLATEVFADNFPSAQVSVGPVETQEPCRLVDQVGSIDLLLA